MVHAARRLQLHKEESQILDGVGDGAAAQKVAQARMARTKAEYLVANAVAGAVADQMAADAQVDPGEAAGVHLVEETAKGVVNHLTAVLQDAAAHEPKAQSPALRLREAARAQASQGECANAAGATAAKAKGVTAVQARRIKILEQSAHEVVATDLQLTCKRYATTMSAYSLREAEEWPKAPFHRPPAKETANASTLARGDAKRTLARRAIHPSHAAAHQEDMGLWWCTKCGETGMQALRKLASPCAQAPTRWGKQNQARLYRGFMPGNSAAATA